MTQIEYIVFSNFLTLFFMAFLFVFTIMGKHLPAKLNRLFLLSIAATFILSLFNGINDYYQRLPEVHYIRTVALVIKNILSPVCAATFLMIIMTPGRKISRLITGILLVEILINLLNLKYPVVFYIDENNVLHNRPLAILIFLSFLFNLAMVIEATVNFSLNTRKAVLTYAVIVSIGLGAVCEATGFANFTVTSAGIISQFFLYLFMHTDLYRTDTLTRLYNRATYNNDLQRFKHRKMVIMTLDLNDLKYWNDNYGHAEGDKAILTSVEEMKKCFERSGIIYRTGGDEFMILFPGKKLYVLQEKIQAFKDSMKKTKYRVALGCAQYTRKDNLEEIIKLADQRMYENKHQIKNGLE